MKILRQLYHPVNWVRQLLKVEPTPQQAQVLDAIRRDGAHVAVRSGHGTGKSAMLAWIILWALTMLRDVRIPCTAPSSHQLFDVLWQELLKWHRKLPSFIDLGGTMVPVKDSIVIFKNRAFVKDRTYDYAVARTARKENPEALQGFHAKNLIFLVDEASGVPEEIFRVAEGALTSKGARVVLTGNPTRDTGYFRDVFRNPGDLWECFRWSSMDSPIVDKSYAIRLKERYGENSDIYRIRVLGEFPTYAEDQFIATDLIYGAMENETEYDENAPVIWGLDPARFGNHETALAERRGNVITWVDTTKNLDGMAIVDWVSERYIRSEVKPDYICVDIIGIGGPIYDRLRQIRMPVVPVNAAAKATNSQKYKNMRAELYDKFHERLREGLIRLPSHDEIVNQATKVKYKFDQSGRLQIVSKTDMPGHIQHSVDVLDAIVLTFFIEPVTKVAKRIQLGQPLWRLL